MWLEMRWRSTIVMVSTLFSWILLSTDSSQPVETPSSGYGVSTNTKYNQQCTWFMNINTLGPMFCFCITISFYFQHHLYPQNHNLSLFFLFIVKCFWYIQLYVLLTAVYYCSRILTSLRWSITLTGWMTSSSAVMEKHVRLSASDAFYRKLHA